MNKKAIKEAYIDFCKDNEEEYINIPCDIDFALSLQREDIIWIDEEATSKKFPYLKATTKQLIELSDDWYVVISRAIVCGDTLEITMESAYEGGHTKKKFAHLFRY